MAYDQSRLEDVHARVSRCLSAVRMGCSRSRQAVIEALAGAGRLLALPDILAAGADQNLAQSSAYRNLSKLASVGVVRRLASNDDTAPLSSPLPLEACQLGDHRWVNLHRARP